MTYITTINGTEIDAHRKYYVEAEGRRMVAIANFVMNDALLLTDGYELKGLDRHGNPDYVNFGMGELRLVPLTAITHVQCLDPSHKECPLELLVTRPQAAAGQ